MKTKDQETIDFIKEIKPRSKSHKVISRDGFINGSIAKVSFTNEDKVIELWIIATKNQKSFADNESQLIQSINAAIKQENGKFSFLKSFINISGLIALSIVAAVIYLAIKNPTDSVPEFLKTAMLTILGFYFGGLVVGKKQKDTDN